MDDNISIVLATHNGEPYLERQLASLAAQTLAPRELIVTDDASSDHTIEIVETFARTAPFPVVIKKNDQSLGFRENFLQACPLAKGEWIAFCDQDDIWRSDKLAICAPYTEHPETTLIAHQAMLIDDSDCAFGFFDQGIKANALKPPLSYWVWDTFWGFSMLVRRSVLDVFPADQRFVDYIDPAHLIAHDRWAFFLAQTLGATVELAEPLAGYRQHDDNLYGNACAKPRLKSRSATIAENNPYIEATKGMLAIVKSLPQNLQHTFPAFDRERAVEVYRSALRQAELRGKIYESGLSESVTTWASMVLSGDYLYAQKKSLRWKSAVKDLALILRT